MKLDNRLWDVLGVASAVAGLVSIAMETWRDWQEAKSLRLKVELDKLELERQKRYTEKEEDPQWIEL